MSSNARSPVAFGSYIITRRIARGGMAEIYRARTRATTDGQEAGWVAVKMMRSSLGHEELRSRLFDREARIASKLDHPNVVPVFEYGTEMDRPYLAMEYIRGRDLSHLAKSEKNTGLPFELSLFVGRQSAAGLGHAHRATDDDGRPLGIVHRDISPGNVMLGYDGSVKVLDFGVARMNETQGFHTQTGTLRGKFAYMSPEQTLGEDLDARSDVFSLGTVLYELLTGINCFRAANPIATLERVQKLRPVPPSRVNREIPKAVDKILARCLAKDRRRRFRDAQALCDAIGEFLDERKYDGVKQLQAHLNGVFSWEKHEEESELLREEEEVALLEVVDFAALRDRSELDAKHIAISEQEEASQAQVKNVARQASGTDIGQGVFEGDDRPPSRVEAPVTPMDQALDAALDLAPHQTGEQVSVSSLLEAAAPVERKTEAVPNPLLSSAGARANLDPATSRTEQASLPRSADITIPPEGGTDPGTATDPGLSTDPGTDPGTNPSARLTPAPAALPKKKRSAAVVFAAIAAVLVVALGVTFAVSREDGSSSNELTTVDPVTIQLEAPENNGTAAAAANPKLRRLDPVPLDPPNKRQVTTRVKRRHPPLNARPKRRSKRVARRSPRKKSVTGFLNVGAKPWASIKIDGKSWPYQTPQAGIELPVGKHRVTLSNPQTGVKKSTVVYIKSGAYKTVMMDLRK